MKRIVRGLMRTSAFGRGLKRFTPQRCAMLAQQICGLRVASACEQQSQSDFEERALAKAFFKSKPPCALPYIA
ncbi:MAG: hypothetical protein GIX02_14320 [Candidatus Eremiobacteraeota bacterium]|nr:hypothetical protein [Candidatus Eremiobacteraeota bacterium]